MAALTGNKGKNLEKLISLGYRVPDFIVLSGGPDEKRIREEVKKKWKRIKYFAVRSSASDEDETERSLAGKYYSQIGVPLSRICAEVRNVERSYRGVAGDVIIQRFIPSQKSGVLFTNDGHGNVLINASFGLCRQVVEGHACDEYTLDSAGKLIDRRIPFSKEYLAFSKGKIQKKVSADGALNRREINILRHTAAKLEKDFGCPQDVEWCFLGRKLFLLQTRPVSRVLPLTPKRTYYDSANIAESYSGIVLPLTLSFARHIYGTVYKNLLHASGVSRKRLERYPEIFDNMVSWFYGRLYYNMNNWYRMMAFIPGYRRNKTNLENMITSNVRIDIERDILPPVGFRIGYPLIVLFKLVWFNFSQRAFKRRVIRYIRDFRRSDLGTYDLDDCRKQFHEFDTRLISRWHVPVENDFMVMTYFGLLKKRISNEEELQQALRFRSKTSEQIQKVRELCIFLRSVPEVREMLSTADRVGFKHQINTNTDIRERLARYFAEYGGRYANELKLESTDIEEDASGLFDLVKLYAEKSPDVKDIPESSEKIRTTMALSKVILISGFRKYARAREEMRLLRSNGFSMMRKLVNRMGVLLKETDMIDKEEDIFYLRMEELFEEGYDLRSLINQRKKEYKKYKSVSPPAHFSLAGEETPDISQITGEPDKIFQGKACSKGIIMGKVRIFEEFSFPGEIDFDIVVAKHTDPGWTPLLGVARGLIVEHGGILSHAAIVSRELNLPTVIGIPNITRTLHTGMMVNLNGNTGTIQIVDED